MGKSNHAVQSVGSISTEHIRALSWNIATEPNLYKELAPNPYTHHSTQLISERFPHESPSAIIHAIVLAEPEGNYDRNFKHLLPEQREKELTKQRVRSAEIHNRLMTYCHSHAKELHRLPEFAYNSLSRVVFQTADLKEIEQRYSQQQRREFRLAIVHFIEKNGNSPVIGHTETKLVRALPLLRGVVVALVLIVLVQFTQKQMQSLTQPSEASKGTSAIAIQRDSKKFPVRLKIPKINVDTLVEYVGITPEGTMDVPTNTIDVGWYKLGPSPGEIGSAVISGHFDGRLGEVGVFNNLDKLKPGDKLYIINALGTITTFVVKESRTYLPGYAEDVFLANDTGAHLNLITCDGVWNKAKKSYSTRLVVFADMLQ